MNYLVFKFIGVKMEVTRFSPYGRLLSSTQNSDATSLGIPMKIALKEMFFLQFQCSWLQNQFRRSHPSKYKILFELNLNRLKRQTNSQHALKS